MNDKRLILPQTDLEDDGEYIWLVIAGILLAIIVVLAFCGACGVNVSTVPTTTITYLAIPNIPD